MITFNDIAVDNVGWSDHGALWIYDFQRETQTQIPITGSKYLSLAQGKGDLFRVLHHGGPGSAISIRSFNRPDIELATVRSNGDGTFAFAGDFSLWAAVESAAILNTDTGQRLVVVDAPSREVRALTLDWYNADT